MMNRDWNLRTVTGCFFSEAEERRRRVKELETLKNRQSIQSLAHVLIVAALALALVAGLTLLFSRLEALAKPPQKSTATAAVTASTVLTPTSQTRSPEKGALIEREGLLAIEGVAWLGDNRPPFPGDPVLSPIENEGRENYVVAWSGADSASNYVLYEADNPYFEGQESIYAGKDTDYFVSGQSAGTYYYRVQAYNAEGASRWSNVESATVGAGKTATTSALRELVAGEPITVWVRIDAGDWQTATVTQTEIDGWDGWDWSFEWTLPEDERYAQHAIHTRAGAEGAFGPTDTITVTVNNRAYYFYLPIVAKRWPPVPLKPAIQEIDNDENRANYWIRWSYNGREGIPNPNSYTVWEDTNSDFSTPKAYNVGGTTSLEIQKNQEGTFYYKVRGNNSYGPGEWSDTVWTTVRLRPYAPTLHNIDNADGDDSYVVRWSYDYAYPSVGAFVLQESTNSDLSDAETYDLGGAARSRAFTNKGSDTYYYRVRGRNGYGNGPWSPIRRVTSVSRDFYDDFNDPGSGWMRHEAWCCLSGCDNGILQQHPQYKYDLFYEDGKYHVKIPLDCRAGGSHGDTRHIYPVVFAPGVERPDSRTCIEAKGAFERYGTYWSFWGLVFAASDDKSTVWSLEVNDVGDWAVLRRTGYDFPGPNSSEYNETRWKEEDWAGDSRPPARAGFESNTLRAEVDGNNVKLYINGEKVYEFSNAEVGSLENVGLIGGDWEITPTQIGYDYFYVDRGCDNY